MPQSQSYFMTDSQSVSQYVLVLSPLWDLWPDITFFLKVAVLSQRGALFDERMGEQFAVQSLNALSHAEPVTILYCLIWDSPNLEGQVPIFISSRNRVAQLYPCALGSLYIASCNSQGYGGGILTFLQPGRPGPRTYTPLAYAFEVDVEVTLQLMANQSICQGIEPTLRLVTRCYSLSEGCCLKVVSCPYITPGKPNRKHRVVMAGRVLANDIVPLRV
jgi:hypothetical protein